MVHDYERGSHWRIFFSRVVEGEIIINLCYIIIGGMFTLVIKYH